MRQLARGHGAPALADLGPVFAWLLDHGVDRETVAAEFGATANYVSVLASRSRGASVCQRGPVGYAVRVEAVTPAQRISDLANRLSEIRSTFAQSQDFAGGIRALDDFRPELGNPGSPALIRVIADWYRHKAWFAAQSSRPVTALEYSSHARQLYRAVYRTTNDNAVLDDLATAALLGSHALIHIGDGPAAQAILAEYRDAVETAGGKLGSDYFRQLGLAYILDAPSTHAIGASILKQVPVVMERVGESHSPVQFAFAGRFHYLFGGDVDIDACETILDGIPHDYAATSLECVIAANYCAAAKLTTQPDSDTFQAGERLVEATRGPAQRYFLQHRVRYLLEMTPRLRLSGDLRLLWLRRLWYLNPFTDDDRVRNREIGKE